MELKQKSLYVVKDKFITIKDPETKKIIQVERTIVRTKNECNHYTGDVTWQTRENGEEYLHFDMVDPTPNELDFPALMECILLSCNDDAEYLPVKLNYESVGHYNEIFIHRDDLELVSGNTGVKVSETIKI